MDSLVAEWLRLDQNPETRAEIEELSRSGKEEELRARLADRIEFGTAGLRGRMEAGFSRMNDLTIIQASQGLCAYILQQNPDTAQDEGVVIGHDHRYNSERWALLTARAFISKGVKVYLHRGIVHTPLVPFSVGRLRAACGVMITASHNPKNDNGYKVYWQNAVQIINPHDKGIAEAIKTNLEPNPSAWSIDDVAESPLCFDKTEEMTELYLDQVSSQIHDKSLQPLNASTDLKFVFTAMHGVGYKIAMKAIETVGFKPFIAVQAQQEPDPDFPTVPYPNPEEKGALNLAIEEANKQGADYVFAVDPDADRFAAVEKQADGKWIQFTGDQLGTLLASSILDRYKKSGRPIDKLAMVASAVSSKMLESMAKAEGFRFTECLTGFKWIGNTALDLEAQGYDVKFGYEEAIGFMCSPEIRDKDGVTALVTFAEMTVASRAEGKRLSDRLNDLYIKYGYHQTKNSYFICRDPEVIKKVFAHMRSFPEPNYSATVGSAKYPSGAAGLPLTAVRDLTTGSAYDSETEDRKPVLPVSGSQMITFKLGRAEDGVQVVMTLRTSGTEPKASRV
ncbi:Phosphoglucomutase-3 [Tulasnella sp. UAMH 9824]|nr:Phosphoglucomutase-3 [Tulasnella sp. UAMH 9824]